MNYRTPATDRLMDAIAALGDRESCYRFFEDACTVRELIDVAQRFKVASMLAEGQSYLTITKETGMSTATISRVSRALSYGTGGYREALSRLEGEDTDA